MPSQDITALSRRALNTAIRIAARRLFRVEQLWLNRHTDDYAPVEAAHKRLAILGAEREMRRFKRRCAYEDIIAYQCEQAERPAHEPKDEVRGEACGEGSSANWTQADRDACARYDRQPDHTDLGDTDSEYERHVDEAAAWKHDPALQTGPRPSWLPANL